MTYTCFIKKLNYRIPYKHKNFKYMYQLIKSILNVFVLAFFSINKKKLDYMSL